MLKVVLWFIGIWAALLVILQLTLSEKVLTKVVNRYAAEYIDGDISFGSASVSMFKRFPRIFLTLEDFAVTYPADRFDVQEKMGAQGHLMYSGCGETADTLASFQRFSASINVMSLAGGTVRIPHLRLVQPRIFAHTYANGDVNWNIFKTESEDEAEDTSSFVMPDIELGRISFSRHPHIVYTDSRDTLFAVIDITRLAFNSEVRANAPISPRNRVGLMVDTMIVAGRIKSDTLALSVQKFYIQENDGALEIDGKGRAMLATNSFGRIPVPIEMSGNLEFPEDTVPAVALKGFKARFADIPLVADADLRMMEGRTGVKARVGIKDCRLNDVFHGFARNIIPELGKVTTDARITMMAECDGDYIHSTGKLPKIHATVQMPESVISHEDLDSLEVRLSLAAAGSTDSRGRINARIDSLKVETKGLAMNVCGDGRDLLGPDPALRVDGSLRAVMDSLVEILPDTLGITATGKITAKIGGEALMSQLSIYNFSRSSLSGSISSDALTFNSLSDTIDVDIKNMDIRIGPEERTSRRDSTRKFRLVGVSAEVKDADISYGEALKVQAKDFFISAKNSVEAEADTAKKVHPFSGRLKARSLNIKDASSASLIVRESDNSFRIFPKRGQPKVPVLSLNSTNERILLTSGRNRLTLSDADIKARAAMNTVERRQKARAFMDSLANVYPDVPRDSLMAHLRAQRTARDIPEWLKEEDFKEQDLNIKLDETLAGYFRDWDITGSIGVTRGDVITPYFPLRNSLNGFDFNFSNDEVVIDKFSVTSGRSRIGAQGKLTGLRRALLGRRQSVLKLDLDITSDRMDANELFTAYRRGSMYVPADSDTENLTDEELLAELTAVDTSAVTDSATSLIVVPANLVAELNLNATNLKYTDLVADTITARMVMKERCIQITDTKALTNMGKMSFDAFYATRSKKDIKVGFDLDLDDITADKVIDLMPSIDTIMPLLKSFSGLLDCEIAATADLDTNMNLVMPSINGIIRIGGEDLTISESDMYRDLARKLMFRNKNEGQIKQMNVEGVINNNTLEVFPFILKVDRYMLALSGIQSLDMSYRYHASLIQSPFLIKLGVDVYGDDFDNMKFRVGKAKYRSDNIPVFTSVVNQTKVNLLKSIREIFDKGVDAAINENIRQAAILDHKKSIGYVNAVDVKMEELSASEQKQLEEEAAAQEGSTQEDSIQGDSVQGAADHMNQ